MATNTRKSSDVLKGGEQPLYQPWDDFSGKPQTRQSEDDIRDNSPIDNGLGNNFNYTGDRSNRTQSATNALRNAENNALKNPSDPSLYTGKGRANNQNVKGKKKKGLGAIITLILIFACGGIFLGGSNSLLGPAMNSLFTTTTDYQYASFSKRAIKLFGVYMNNDSESIVKNNWYGAKKYAEVSDSFKKSLAMNGIEFEGSGRSKTISWTHTDTDGKITTKTGITASEFVNMLETDVDLYNDYSIAVNNRSTSFYDTSANKTFQHLGNNRNTFKNFEDTGNTELNNKAYNDTVRSRFNNDKTTLQTAGREKHTEEREVTGEDGTVRKETYEVTEDIRNNGSGTTNNAPEAATNSARSIIDNAAKEVGEVKDWACSAMRVGNMISMAIAANEMYQSIRFFMGLMEPISKTMAGYGDQAPIHQVLNFLSTPATTTTSNFKNASISLNGANSTISLGEDLVQNGSPLDANGMQVILGNASVNKNAVSSTFSRERLNSTVLGQLSNSSAGTSGCSVLDIGESVVSIGVSVASAIGSGGLSIFAGVTKRIILATVSSVAISAFFSFLLPTLAKVFCMNLADYAIGIPGGEIGASGAGAIGSKSAQRNSGHMPGSPARLVEYNKVTNEVLALDAERDRNRLSPFDTSNPNTFFGSIAYSLLPTLTSSKINSLSSLLRSTTSSLSSLLGGVHAEGEGSSYLTTPGDCPNLERIGVEGDMYCNVKTAADQSTIDLSPTDDTYVEKISEGQDCSEDGNCTIDPKSELGKYITYCDNRDSQFGVIDQNILAAMQPSDPLGIAGSALGVIPVVGDLLQIFDALSNLENLDWASGAKCVNSEENSWWQSNGKYYQRYVEDMRILNANGAFEATNSKNPVLAFEEELEKQYYEEHPEADTYIGYLSRISGLNLDNTKTVLAFVEYYNYLDQYDPSLRIAMTGDTSEIKNGEQIASEIKQEKFTITQKDSVHIETENTIIAVHPVVYADLRNRSYAIC